MRPPHDWVVLDAPGWDVTYISDPLEGGSEVEWTNGEATLNVHLYPADLRDSYVEDRERIDYPRVDRGTPVELLGQPARMWHYSARDHTTIGAVDGTVYPEVRAQGMDEAAYVALLARLAWTDEAEFELTLPEQFVTARRGRHDHRRDAPRHPPGAGRRGPELGRERSPTSSGPTWRARSCCPWIAEFAPSPCRRGTPSRRGRAARHSQACRDWAFLDAMNAEGDYPEVVWEMSADVNAGPGASEYRQGLGCE